MQKIMEDEGIELYNNDGQYYLRYDSGELMIKMKNLRISQEEAKTVVENPDCAYNIILAYQDRGIYGDDDS